MTINPFASLSSLFSDKGLVLIASLPLSEKLRSFLPPGFAFSSDKQWNLLLVGHGGRAFWDAFQSLREQLSTSEPMDEFSLKSVREVLSVVTPQASYDIVYPSERSISLPPLLEEVGWCHPSPLGLGIHEEWGLWQAVRVALVVEGNWSEFKPASSLSPCLSCLDKPCLKSCPASATNEDGFVLDACVSYRFPEDSPCKDHCLARLSCPVGTEHRYSREQLKFHYGQSWEMIRQWKEECRGGGGRG